MHEFRVKSSAVVGDGFFLKISHSLASEAKCVVSAYDTQIIERHFIWIESAKFSTKRLHAPLKREENLRTGLHRSNRLSKRFPDANLDVRICSTALRN